MLKVTVVFSLICLSLGIFMRDRCGPFTPEIMRRTPMSSYHIRAGLYTMTPTVQDMQDQIDVLVPKVVNSTSDKDWKDIMAGMVQLMDDGLSLYQDVLHGTLDAGGRMFDGDYYFTEVKRCTELRKSIHSTDYYTVGFYPTFKLALGKDLPCISNLLSEVYGLQLNGSPRQCATSDEEVIDVITNLARIFFRLRNDGDSFFENVTRASLKNGTSLRNHFKNAFDGTDGDLVRRLLRNFDKY